MRGIEVQLQVNIVCPVGIHSQLVSSGCDRCFDRVFRPEIDRQGTAGHSKVPDVFRICEWFQPVVQRVRVDCVAAIEKRIIDVQF